MDSNILIHKVIYNDFHGVITDKSVVSFNNCSIEVDSIWDTGSARSFISDKVIKTLKLKPQGTDFVIGVKDIYPCELYDINIQVFDNILYSIQAKSFTRTPKRPFDLLIGMDIIYKGSFSLGFENGKYSLCFKYDLMSGFTKVTSSSLNS